MGKTKNPAYQVWADMKQRCLNPKVPQYHNYGGRGITVCDRWLSSFENFLIDMGEKPAGKSIDRINNDGNYEPGNCRWATSKEQRDNQRTTHLIEIQGVTKPLRDWARDYGIHETTIHGRLRRGWDIESAVKTPVSEKSLEISKAGNATRWGKKLTNAAIQAQKDGHG